MSTNMSDTMLSGLMKKNDNDGIDNLMRPSDDTVISFDGEDDEYTITKPIGGEGMMPDGQEISVESDLMPAMAGGSEC